MDSSGVKQSSDSLAKSKRSDENGDQKKQKNQKPNQSMNILIEQFRRIQESSDWKSETHSKSE